MKPYEIMPAEERCECDGGGGNGESILREVSAPMQSVYFRRDRSLSAAPFEIAMAVPSSELTLPQPIFQGPNEPTGGVEVDPMSVTFETPQCRALSHLVKSTYLVFQYERERLDLLNEQLRVLRAYRTSPPGTPLFYSLEDPCTPLNDAASVATRVLAANPSLSSAQRDQLLTAYQQCARYRSGSTNPEDRMGFLQGLLAREQVLLSRIAIQSTHARQAYLNYQQASFHYVASCAPPSFFASPLQ